MPFSIIVTTVEAVLRLIVTALWYDQIARVGLVVSFRQVAEPLDIGVVQGASTSSSTQIGAGLVRKERNQGDRGQRLLAAR